MRIFTYRVLNKCDKLLNSNREGGFSTTRKNYRSPTTVLCPGLADSRAVSGAATVLQDVGARALSQSYPVFGGTRVKPKMGCARSSRTRKIGVGAERREALGNCRAPFRTQRGTPSRDPQRSFSEA